MGAAKKHGSSICFCTVQCFSVYRELTNCGFYIRIRRCQDKILGQAFFKKLAGQGQSPCRTPQSAALPTLPILGRKGIGESPLF